MPKPFVQSRLTRPVSHTLFQNPDARGFPQLCLLIDLLGLDAIHWSPATICLEIADETGAEPDPFAFERLMGAVGVLISDAFYRSLPDFVRLTLALRAEPGETIADTVDCAISLTEAGMINPPDKNEEQPFSPEILAYLGAILDREGILVAPDILQIATRNEPRLLERASRDFSDDPEMFATIESYEKDKTESINAAVKDHVVTIMKQLEGLQLRTGRTQIATTILQRLKENEDANPDFISTP